MNIKQFAKDELAKEGLTNEETSRIVGIVEQSLSGTLKMQWDKEVEEFSDLFLVILMKLVWNAAKDNLPANHPFNLKY